MKDNNIKLILVLILIIIILGGIFVFKIFNENNYKPMELPTFSYSKDELIALIKSEKNKSNYEVEYTVNNQKTKIKYLNKKMKSESTTDNVNTLYYFDFEKDTSTVVKEDKKEIFIFKNIKSHENYIPDDILQIIESPYCTMEKEEQLSNRNAIVLNYDGTYETFDSILENAKNTNSNNNKINYNLKIWIDAETGFLLQTQVKADGKEQIKYYDLKLNSVTPEDVTIPNLSQYKVTDTTK